MDGVGELLGVPVTLAVSRLRWHRISIRMRFHVKPRCKVQTLACLEQRTAAARASGSKCARH